MQLIITNTAYQISGKVIYGSNSLKRDLVSKYQSITTFSDHKVLGGALNCLFSSQFITFAGAAITQIFEGEPDHLIPSVSDELLDNNMFTIAGRMIGHSFLHCGPSFPGLSPAIIHILFGGSLGTCPVTLQDCPDLEIRDVLKMVNMKTIEVHIFN